MTSHEMVTAAQALLAAAGVLQDMALLEEQRSALEKAVGDLNAQCVDLEHQRRAIQEGVETEQKVAEAARLKDAASQGSRVKLATSQVEDLIRQKAALEATLTDLRQTIEAQGRTAVAEQSAHLVRIEQLKRDTREAAAALAQMQERIKGVHADLAGLAGRGA